MLLKRNDVSQITGTSYSGGPCTYRPFHFFIMALGMKDVFNVNYLVNVKEKAKQQKPFLYCMLNALSTTKQKAFSFLLL